LKNQVKRPRGRPRRIQPQAPGSLDAAGATTQQDETVREAATSATNVGGGQANREEEEKKRTNNDEDEDRPVVFHPERCEQAIKGSSFIQLMTVHL
jgi:hypothetical protein